jgi:hypothetical protein
MLKVHDSCGATPALRWVPPIGIPSLPAASGKTQRAGRCPTIGHRGTTIRMAANSKPTIFISSTCYDLVDLRAYLRHRLEAWGAVVKLSEDPHSGFAVDPLVDSIESCKQNVATSDVVIAVLDKRYGPPLPAPYGGRSATHVEIDYAHELGKPVLLFIRTLAHQDFQKIKREPESKTFWVEPDDSDRRKQWADFVKSLSRIPDAGQARSNWVDPFTSCVDLAQLIESRLAALYPLVTIGQAMQSDRLSRVYFVPEHAPPIFGAVTGYFRNAGPQPAFDLTQGVLIDGQATEIFTFGGLGVQEAMLLPGKDSWKFPIDPSTHGALAIYCQYANARGDRYRVEVPCSLKSVRRARRSLRQMQAQAKPEYYDDTGIVLNPERLFVLGGDPYSPQWILAN